MYSDINLWSEVRRRVLVEGESKRSVRADLHLHWSTIERMLAHPAPPGYVHKQPRSRPKIDPFLAIIDDILEKDKSAPRKQRHTALRVFHRLRDEHGYTGGYTGVKDAVRERAARQREVFIPLQQPPGEAQVDFGHAEVFIDGESTKVALFVILTQGCFEFFMK